MSHIFIKIPRWEIAWKYVIDHDTCIRKLTLMSNRGRVGKDLRFPFSIVQTHFFFLVHVTVLLTRPFLSTSTNVQICTSSLRRPLQLCHSSGLYILFYYSHFIHPLYYQTNSFLQ